MDTMIEITSSFDDQTINAGTEITNESAAYINASDVSISNTPEFIEYDSSLELAQHDINFLEEKYEDVERADFNGEDLECSYKLCATRHGCSGATNCNACYGDYRR